MVANPGPVDPIRISQSTLAPRAGRRYSPRSRRRISASRTAMAASAPRSPGS